MRCHNLGHSHRGCVPKYHQQHGSTACAVDERTVRGPACDQGAGKDLVGVLNISGIFHKTSFNIPNDILGL